MLLFPYFQNPIIQNNNCNQLNVICTKDNGLQKRNKILQPDDFPGVKLLNS